MNSGSNRGQERRQRQKGDEAALEIAPLSVTDIQEQAGENENSGNDKRSVRHSNVMNECMSRRPRSYLIAPGFPAKFSGYGILLGRIHFKLMISLTATISSRRSGSLAHMHQNEKGASFL